MFFGQLEESLGARRQGHVAIQPTVSVILSERTIRIVIDCLAAFGAADPPKTADNYSALRHFSAFEYTHELKDERWCLFPGVKAVTYPEECIRCRHYYTWLIKKSILDVWCYFFLPQRKLFVTWMVIMCTSPNSEKKIRFPSSSIQDSSGDHRFTDLSRKKPKPAFFYRAFFSYCMNWRVKRLGTRLCKSPNIISSSRILHIPVISTTWNETTYNKRNLNI